MNILKAPHPMLEKTCRPFDFAAPERDPHDLGRRMVDTMRYGHGIGLAAPQVGIDLRVFVMFHPQGDLVCFNPEIVARRGGREFADEGCLSFPKEFLRVGRDRFIDVSYQTPAGELKTAMMDGLAARCFQHELDHLNGKTFDKAAPPLAKAMRMKELARRRGR